MSTYAIGDVQGCFHSLCALLDRIAFDPDEDAMWLVGDLVNRGPRSADVLRWARALGDRAEVVLGNHDLHLLSAYAGVRAPKSSDTLRDVLDASDAGELVDWLRSRPLFHRQGGYAMVHAGLHPRWSLERAAELAGEVEAVLRADDWQENIGELRGACSWSDDLTGTARLRAIASVLTRIRTCTGDGQMSDDAGPPEHAPAGYLPWFEQRQVDDDARILFGHWATMGHRTAKGYVALDSGCVWGGKLTAFRLEDGAVFQQPAVERRA